MTNPEDFINTKKEILNLLEGEEIEAISLDANEIEFYEKDKIEEALKKLDFKFDVGYGGRKWLFSLYLDKELDNRQRNLRRK